MYSYVGNKVVDNKIEVDQDLFWNEQTSESVMKRLDKIADEARLLNINPGIIMPLDYKWYSNDWLSKDITDKYRIGVVIDIEADFALMKEIIKKSNIKILKILPYESRILKKDYQKVIDFLNYISDLNIAVIVCCAYGSELVYQTNGVELAEFILRSGFSKPLILAHGGMVKIFDAHSLMTSYDNVYIDLSFALDYWNGSSLIKDYAFAIKKVKGERILYGSDYPVISFQDAMETFACFCKEHEISDEYKDKIMLKNYRKLLDSLEG